MVVYFVGMEPLYACPLVDDHRPRLSLFVGVRVGTDLGCAGCHRWVVRTNNTHIQVVKETNQPPEVVVPPPPASAGAQDDLSANTHTQDRLTREHRNRSMIFISALDLSNAANAKHDGVLG